MKCLVTGGTGFIGSNIVKHLLSERHEVTISGNGSEQKIDEKVKVLFESFDDPEWKEKLEDAGHFGAVFHQAAINDTTLLDREKMFKANVDSPKRLFDIVVNNGCKRIVYASSTAAYGDAPAPYVEFKTIANPLNPYGESKLVFDDFAMQFAAKNPGVKIVGLRYCNVYGHGESHKGKRASMIYQLAQQMKTGNPKIFCDGNQRRDYIYIKDVVRANSLAAIAENSCVVNCGSGKSITFNEIISALNRSLGLNRVPEYIPMPETLKERYQNFTLCDMNYAAEMIRFIPEFEPHSGISDFAKKEKLLS